MELVSPKGIPSPKELGNLVKGALIAGTSVGSTFPITNLAYLINTVLGWNKWKSSETSFPATYKITPLPAGWKFKNFVTS